MSTPKLLAIIVVAGVMLSAAGPVFGRMAPDAKALKDNRGVARLVDAPAHELVAHRVGKIVLGISNNATFGNYYTRAANTDAITGEEVPSCEYPKFSNNQYLFGAAFWIGAVVGRDTLVSVGADGWQHIYEFNPDVEPFGKIKYRSMIDLSAPEAEGAISEEDYICVYMDTIIEGSGTDWATGRQHIPLNIEVTEASYAWSYEYAEDIVLFDYQVTNIGTQPLKDAYMGIYVDADIHFEGGGDAGAQDDFSGFVQAMPMPYGDCMHLDTVFIAWTADNDGDLMDALPTGQPVPCVTATRIVRTPAKELNVSFNWWAGNANPTFDYGPREKPYKGKWKEAYRDYGTGGSGTPEGDANKYYVLRNQEFDFDQPYTAKILPTDSLWLSPLPSHAAAWAQGLDTRYLLSFGPFDINPGERLPISFAYVGGEDFHTERGNIANLPNDPDVFYGNLGFEDLGLNARWASWIYDNPGVDTDGDGYYGEFFLCYPDVADSSRWDTAWIRGDNVPDFRGASPPPAPDIWIEPGVGELTVRFNGLRSETTPDVFSREVDFEGYRVYIARDERATSYSMVASYDVEDYNKYVQEDGQWKLFDVPYSLDELRCLYGDSCGDLSFDPLDFDMSSPYQHPLYPADSLFYFSRQDYNASVLGITTPIRKRFPDQPYPSSLNPDSAFAEELTEDGQFKYFEYEYVIRNLLSTVHFWVNVTAFDFGSPQSGLPSLETSVTVGAKEACPLAPWDEVNSKDMQVYVWPNPYRVDGDYRTLGFEGRGDEDRPDDRVRAVRFANLPPKCTIRIFTLDGDLVREIVHDKDCVGPCATTDEWNLITRNTQLAVSGLYYWTVEDEEGKVQIGKLMLIM